MSNTTYLHDLNVRGRYLFTYSRKDKVWTVLYEMDNNKIYLIESDRTLAIIEKTEIILSEKISPQELLNAIFFIPRKSPTGKLLIMGAFFRGTKTIRFQISNNKLSVGDPIQYKDNVNGVEYNVALTMPISFFKRLEKEGSEVTHAISKKNKLHITVKQKVIDEDSYSYYYAVVDKRTGLYDKLYTLYSDTADHTLLGLHIDTGYNSIYLVGFITPLDNPVNIKPYFERLLC